VHLPPTSQSLNRVGSKPRGPLISFGSSLLSSSPRVSRNVFSRRLNALVGGLKSSSSSFASETCCLSSKFSTVSRRRDSRNLFCGSSFLRRALRSVSVSPLVRAFPCVVLESSSRSCSRSENDDENAHENLDQNLKLVRLLLVDVETTSEARFTTRDRCICTEAKRHENLHFFNEHKANAF